MTPVVSVVIPCWGDRIHLDKCLEALRSHTNPLETPYEIICIDNGMNWDIDADVVIRNPANRCFSIACNQGSAVAGAEYLCLLNMDAFVQPGWLPPLLAEMDEPSVAACGPKIVHPDGSLQTAGGIRTFHGSGSAGGEELKIDGPSCDADGVTAACMLVRKSVYDELGGMYEGYWAGAEDVDFCLTVREAGHRIRYCASSLVQHVEGASGQARWVRVHENVALLNQRWAHR